MYGIIMLFLPLETMYTLSALLGIGDSLQTMKNMTHADEKDANPPARNDKARAISYFL